ncbi:hypothetical protein T08_7549 [Trichinella sp. T8]|nr:hypothetical protein T08_7549 [Trichinella sp. T8]
MDLQKISLMHGMMLVRHGHEYMQINSICTLPRTHFLSGWMCATSHPSYPGGHSIFAELFATHGLPKCLVTDNSTAFKSAKFLAFLKSNSIHNITTAPFHPSSNGQAECAAQSPKKAMEVSPLATEVSSWLAQLSCLRNKR